MNTGRLKLVRVGMNVVAGRRCWPAQRMLLGSASGWDCSVMFPQWDSTNNALHLGQLIAGRIRHFLDGWQLGQLQSHCTHSLNVHADTKRTHLYDTRLVFPKGQIEFLAENNLFLFWSKHYLSSSTTGSLNRNCSPLLLHFKSEEDRKISYLSIVFLPW